MPSNDTTTSPPQHVGSTAELGTAPRWWHCDTHGAGKLSAWGCPDCVAELRRWKSTHAPRLDALEALLSAAQIEAAQGREARATLESERAANAMLTDEVERLRGLIAELLDTELAYLACAGSHAQVEDILGRMQAALKPNREITGPSGSGS